MASPTTTETRIANLDGILQRGALASWVESPSFGIFEMCDLPITTSNV
jgi:hypothetical protein